jgi:hypothetical protein
MICSWSHDIVCAHTVYTTVLCNYTFRFLYRISRIWRNKLSNCNFWSEWHLHETMRMEVSVLSHYIGFISIFARVLMHASCGRLGRLTIVVDLTWMQNMSTACLGTVFITLRHLIHLSNTSAFPLHSLMETSFFGYLSLFFFFQLNAKQVQHGKDKLGKYNWSKWEINENLLGLRGLERAPSLIEWPSTQRQESLSALWLIHTMPNTVRCYRVHIENLSSITTHHCDDRWPRQTTLHYRAEAKRWSKLRICWDDSVSRTITRIGIYQSQEPSNLYIGVRYVVPF